MKRVLILIAKTSLLPALLAFAVLIAWAFDSRSMPALGIWHTVSLSSEFTASDAIYKSTLQDYLNREERLFSELHEKIISRVKPSADTTFCRYRSGGPQDPESLQRNWNRTFELIPQHIQGGVLLLHGLTDSPYSLRRIGQILYARGYYVLGLRLPAHGTSPAALTEVRWEDWVAATRMAARHVRERIGPNRPFLIAGYSNGGALALKYSLDALSDPELPDPDRILLFSPEIGISPLAFIAKSHKLLSFLPYFAQFKWLSIEPEYDPFKYNSFPKNAVQQAYEITMVLQRQIDDMRKHGHFSDFPPVITFLSWVDDTVKTSATINHLYEKLENTGSELVVFDVNRFDKLTPFLSEANDAMLKNLMARSDLPYRLTLITNVSPDANFVTELTKGPYTILTDSRPLQAAWPPGVYSLSHVAVPFPSDDPVYGALPDAHSTYQGLSLGRIQPRGETGLLRAPLSKLMRLRYNPFFGYLQKRIEQEIDDLQ